MKTYILEDGQKPSEETLKRVSELRDEDIVYDDDCPELTPKMEQALSRAVAEGKNDEAVVKIHYDDEAKVWVAISSYLALESESYDELLELIDDVTQEMMDFEECPKFASIKVVTEDRVVFL